MKLLIATHNEGKKREFLAMLSGIFPEIELLEYPRDFVVIEDGNTFRENAIKKAHAAINRFNVVTIVDDSGLEVDALNGEPGIYSARYSGENASDLENNQKLINALQNVEDKKSVKNRNARFVAEVVIAFPPNQKHILPEGAITRCSVEKGCISFFAARGICEGEIIDEARGENGFGYDPHFLIPEWGLTMAEVELERKATISHRANALEILREILAG